MLTVQLPAAPETVVIAGGKAYQETRFSVLSSGILDSFPRALVGLVSGTKTARIAVAISRIEIFPGPLNLLQGQETTLSAVAYAEDDEPLSGINFEWTIEDVGRSIPVRPMVGRTFRAQTAGTFSVRASANGVEAQIPVNVEPFVNSVPLNTATYTVSSRTGTVVQTTATTPVTKGETNKVDVKEPASQSNLLEGEGWDNTNYTYADAPGNSTGSRPGAPADGGAGSGNFQFSAPVVSLPGRGIDLALNLNYNSRLWAKTDNKITYDIDHGYPAPGWNLGFGRLMFMGSLGGCMMLDADGTRRSYAGYLPPISNGTSFRGHTTDGSMIDYGCTFYPNSYGLGWARLPNGTTITYETTANGNSHAVPTQITDAQGNFITIAYRNPSSEAIANITDTLGRVITFHYDSLNRLTSIRAPRMDTEDNGVRTRTVVRLHYKALSLSHSFSGLTPVTWNNTPWVIDAIYYPGTGTGYWFDDTDSYSTYGMITKVSEQRDMTWTTGPQTQGTMTRGTTTKEARYNYPLSTSNDPDRTNGLSLTDAPTYTRLNEYWAGRDVNEDAVTYYSFNENDSRHDGTSLSPARSVTVTQPTGIISKQYTYRTPGAWTDGLTFADDTIVMNGSTPVSVASSLVSWQLGNASGNRNYDSPRPGWAKAFDENGDEVRTEYTYGTNKFNQITRSCDYDDANVLLRCSNAEYENDASYIGIVDEFDRWLSGNHVFNLVKSTSIENAAGVKVSRTDYEYDNYSAQPFTNTPGVIQHLQTHNAFTTATQNGECSNWHCDLTNCGNTQPPDPGWSCVAWYQVSVYDPATEKRGNITKVTSYSDAQNATGSIYETRAYDITGNVVKSSSACCEETSTLYDDPNTTEIDTQYAYPMSQTRGSGDPNSPHRMTAKSTYLYQTGLVKTSTDANGLVATNSYNPDTLRLSKTLSSTGAFNEFGYDDTAMTTTDEVFQIVNSVPVSAGKTKKYLNGVGKVRKEESYVPGAIDIAETMYTKFGEEWKTSRPYRAGDTIQWSEKFYDSQRRLIKVVEPDGSETKAFYNETTLPDSVSAQPGNRVRVQDAWGRDRWGRYDQQNRLIQVVEPNLDPVANPTGSVFTAGSLLTKYSYDTVGRLTQTEQGVQFRKFKFDDLGRMTSQKLAEQTATLNDAGTFVGAGQSGADWSEAFVYDTRSNLTQKTDARGVRTNFSYNLSGGGLDPLNRIQSRSYDTSGPLQSGLTIHNTWGALVSYEYVTTGDKSRLKKIETQGILTEEYLYDSESRVSEYKQTVASRASYPMTTSYLYDTLDRVKEIHYPAQYGLAGSPRKILSNTFDSASRMESVSYNSGLQASAPVYNASEQVTQMKIGANGTNQVTEEYTFDQPTGLLTNQTATKNGGTQLLNLDYSYNRLGSVGSLNGKTGHLTKIVDNLNNNKNREYVFDVVGRLKESWGGPNKTLSVQSYAYDRYGNRTSVGVNGIAADGNAMPRDGIAALSYDNTSNRITTSGFEYDNAGNQTRAIAEDGVTWLKYEYDAGNRISVVKRESDGATLQWFHYGSTNARVMDWESGTGTVKLSASVGGTTLAEYTEFQSATPTWTKGYTYLGDSQLATVTPNGSSGETIEFNHPDRLGTRVKTNQVSGASSEQAHLPFGTALNNESSLTTNNNRFTSYDRSLTTGLDYAINRTYDSKQGRFTQVDPIGMEAADLNVPQSLNLYSYCENDPINHVDPEGLFFGKIFKWIFKHIKKILAVVAVVVAVIALVAFPWSGPITLKAVLGLVAALSGAASSIFELAGLTTLSKVFGFIAMAAGMISLGITIKDAWTKFKDLMARNSPFSLTDDIILRGVINETVTVNTNSWLHNVAQAFIDFRYGLMDAFTFGYASQWASPLSGGIPNTHSVAYSAGDYCGTAASFAVPGGAAMKLGNVAKSAVAVRGGIRTMLFAKGSGVLNNNRYIRLGWNKFRGKDVFRLAVGSKGKKVHWHKNFKCKK